MKESEKDRVPRAGCFFLGCRRFMKEGAGTERGPYTQRVERIAQRIIDQLEGNTDIIFPGIIYSQEDVQQAYASFIEQEADYVICSFLTFAEDELWIRFLRMNSTIPMAYLSITFDGLPFESCYEYDDFVEFLASSALVGTCNGSGSIRRLDRSVEIFIGNIDTAVKEVSEFGRVCMVSSLMKKAQFGLMPAYNLLMRNTYVSPYELLVQGPDIEFISYAELASVSEEVKKSEITAWKNQLLKAYPCDHDIDDVKMDASVKYSLGLEKIMDKYQLDALALHDAHLELFETVGLRPGFYPPGINDKKSVLVSEGDIGAAYMALVMKLLTGKQTNFIEPFLLQPDKGTFFGGHGGPNDYTYPVSDKHVLISKDMRNEKSPYRYAGAPFAWLRIPPGSMTLAQFSEVRGVYRIICFEAQSLEGPHIINGYAHSEFKPLHITLKELFHRLLEIGITQHFIGAEGCYIQELQQFARLNAIEFHHIH